MSETSRQDAGAGAGPDRGHGVAVADPTGRLLQTQRQDEILRRTLARGRVDVAELAASFAVTTETIRRDLSGLQEQRLVRRVHGGAVAWERFRHEPLLAKRDAESVSEKRRIARLAVEELPPEGTVLIDSGSTTARLVEAIPRSSTVTVVTNSLVAAQALVDHDLDVILLGGTLRKNTLATLDAQTVAGLSDLAVSTLFLSCDGFTAARGLSTPYQDEAALKRAMIAAADRVVALVDSSKLGKDHLVRFAAWEVIDVLITDDGVDEATVATIEAAGTMVRRA